MFKRYSPRNIRGLLRAKDGISAVEFALIAPLMMLIYFACIELSLMMVLDRKVTTSTATLGDLTARAAVVTDDDLDDIFQATRMIFQPNDVKVARMRISSIYDDDGVNKVAWSDGCGLSSYPEDQSVTIPNGLVPSGGSIIMAEIEYDYNSVLGYFFTTTQTLTDEFYLRPRRVDFVDRLRNGTYGCAVTTPAP
ncbi:MAG: pilus assembly protein [Henriciella sp.]|nr:pilus assembly protein [Henriciella sp.]